jgi:hypothetical protein
MVVVIGHVLLPGVWMKSADLPGQCGKKIEALLQEKHCFAKPTHPA